LVRKKAVCIILIIYQQFVLPRRGVDPVTGLPSASDYAVTYGVFEKRKRRIRNDKKGKQSIKNKRTRRKAGVTVLLELRITQ